MEERKALEDIVEAVIASISPPSLLTSNFTLSGFFQIMVWFCFVDLNHSFILEPKPGVSAEDSIV